MNLDIIPNGAIKRVHVSQNDVGRTLTFELFNNSTSYTVPSGATVKIQGTKPSGFGFSETCTVSGNTVTVDTTEEMTDEYGYIDTELQITYSGNKIGTSNFVLAVERNPHPDTITDGSTATIIPELTLLVNEVKGYAEEIEGTYHAYGSPWVASTVAQMTDTDKIYVYTGSETGYVNGNWYYHNGSSWVSGGVYNAVAVNTDTTLTQSGVPADAKVTGIVRDLTIEKSDNLFDGTNGYASTMRYYENGYEYSNANYYTTPYIEVGNNEWYHISSTSCHICLWDADKVFISGDLIFGTGTNDINTGTASYITLSVPNNAKSTTKLLLYKNVYDDVFESIKANGKVLDELVEPATNLFLKSQATDGYIYYYENGNQYSNANYCTSAFVECDKNSWYVVASANTHICLWDENQTFIKGLLIVALNNFKFNTENASYITISIPTNIKDTVRFGKLTFPHRAFEAWREGYIYKTFNIPADVDLSNSTNVNTACLKLPSNYDAYGTPTKLCIICHGASGGISSTTGWTLSADYNNIVNALLNAGFAVMDSNGYSDSATLGYNHWGCPQALAGYYLAWDDFTKRYNLDREVYVYGFSMGGMTALSLMYQGTIPIKCAMIASPVISLYQHCVVQNNNVARDDFKNAYQVNDYSEEAVRGYDRYLDIKDIDGTTYVFNTLKPLLIGYGTTDTAVSNAKIAEYYNALKNTNSNVILKAYTGGHEISYGQSGDVIADIVRWFKRY